MNLNLPSAALEFLRKRLLHQSARRGMRELDLLLGSWAEKHLPSLSEAELRSYEQILGLGEPVLWHFLREPSAQTPEGLDPATQALLERIRTESNYTESNYTESKPNSNSSFTPDSAP